MKTRFKMPDMETLQTLTTIGQNIVVISGGIFAFVAYFFQGGN